MYYKDLVEEKRIPSFLAFFIIFIMVVGAASILKNKPQTTSSQARQTSIKRLEITNCSPASCTIFALSEKPEFMWLVYGEDQTRMNLTASDSRDLESDQKLRLTHYFEVKNLLVNTKYSCQLVTKDGVGSLPCSFTTIPKFTTLSSNLTPAVGKVILQNGSPAEDSIVIMSLEGANKLSSITEKNGGFIIPFFPLTRTQTNQPFQPSPQSGIKIEIINDEGGISNISVSLKNINRLESKTIRLGENYSLDVEEQNVLSAVSKNTVAEKSKIDIIFPQEGAAIAGNKPYFKGIALPGRKIRLKIEGGESYTFFSDKKGIWSLTPSAKFESGKKTMSIYTTDINGNDIKLTRSFTILKSGEAVLGVATPSGTLTPTLEPSPTVEPTLSQVTPVPTEVVVTPTPTPPVSGFSPAPYLVTSLGLIFFGTLLFFIF